MVRLQVLQPFVDCFEPVSGDTRGPSARSESIAERTSPRPILGQIRRSNCGAQILARLPQWGQLAQKALNRGGHFWRVSPVKVVVAVEQNELGMVRVFQLLLVGGQPPLVRVDKLL